MTLALQQAVPLINMTASDGAAVKMSKAGTTMASLPVFDGQKSVASMSGMNSGGFQERFSSSHRGDTWGAISQPGGGGFYSDFHSRESIAEGDMFNGMALSDHFLGQYYNQVITNLKCLIFMLNKQKDSNIKAYFVPKQNLMHVFLFFFYMTEGQRRKRCSGRERLSVGL